jgi:tRNA G18 (ribose-2'-O)-methylase SpoU
MCDHIVFIEQEGSCRSLNAAVAGSIIMYEWSRNKFFLSDKKILSS